jgi:hypothetical protein
MAHFALSAGLALILAGITVTRYTALSLGGGLLDVGLAVAATFFLAVALLAPIVITTHTIAGVIADAT